MIGADTTPTDPSNASWLVHTSPGPGVGGEIVSALPFKSGLLKNLKLSPAAKTGPRFVIVIVLLPALVSVPFTCTKSFVTADDPSTSNITFPASVRLPCKTSVPIPPGATPGANVPPDCTVT